MYVNAPRSLAGPVDPLGFVQRSTRPSGLRAPFLPVNPSHEDGPRAAEPIVDQLESDGIPNIQIIETDVNQIAPIEKHIAAIF
jgi:hypothetical protein